MRAEEVRRFERAERMMIRWMYGVTLRDRCKSEELRKRLDIEDVVDVVRKSRLRWFGHLERKDVRDWTSVCRNIVVQEILENVDRKRDGGKLWKRT